LEGHQRIIARIRLVEAEVMDFHLSIIFDFAFSDTVSNRVILKLNKVPRPNLVRYGLEILRAHHLVSDLFGLCSAATYVSCLISGDPYQLWFDFSKIHGCLSFWREFVLSQQVLEGCMLLGKRCN
jgi:hypothetical protein